jgi:D-alanyl-D-alanine carboxypeptidase/D-alanyl-D-alanine-endopeptidase (penicillin-binding protein 4)
LATQLNAALDQAPLDTAHVGLVLQTQGESPRTLYSHNGDRLFTPASSQKLLTTAAALHHLGADYRLRTSVYAAPAPGPGAVLRVVGRGDPTVTGAQLDALAQQVRQSGVSQVGRLELEDAYLPGPATNPTWEWEDAQWAYAAPVNSLILNRNAIALRLAPTQVGSPLSAQWVEALPAGPLPLVNDSRTVATGATGAAAVPVQLWRRGDTPTLRLTGAMAQGDDPQTYRLSVLNPAEQFAAAMAQALARQGIAPQTVVVTQQAAAIADPEIAFIESPPVGELVVAANRDSDNLTAEALFKTIGATAGQPPGEAVQAALGEMGIALAGLRLADGSGLSRHNLVSPAALVQILQVMAEHPQGRAFLPSLAIVGQSGTLTNRLRDTVLAGRVQAKSGALTGTVSLAGYLQPPGYEPLVFALVINHSNQHASVLRRTIDQILLEVAQLTAACP